MLKRKLGSWVEAFTAYTEGFPSPLIFRKWGAISAIAGALERKIWCTTGLGNFYPHLYVILCGPPSVGKSIITSLVDDIWNKLDDQFVAPTNMSRATLMDSLKAAERKIVIPDSIPPVTTFNSLKIASNELGVLMPVYDNDIMNHLQDIWDGKRYAEMKRTSEISYTIKNPQINLLTACTPSYLKATLPDGAWDQGFISRSLIIFSGENIFVDIFEYIRTDTTQHDDLVNDLNVIGKYYEKITFHGDVTRAFYAWQKAGAPPKPDHPKLLHYTSRRSSQLIKLCMIACVDRGPKDLDTDFVVIPEDYQTAQSWLFDAEMYMNDIFKSMAQGGDSGAMDQIWHYAYKMYMKEIEKNGKSNGITEMKIIHYASALVPTHNVVRIVDTMVRAGMLVKKFDCYIPAARKDG